MLVKKIKSQALIYINGCPVYNLGTQSIKLGFSEQTDFSPPPPPRDCLNITGKVCEDWPCDSCGKGF